jgi:hypothetical protein
VVKSGGCRRAKVVVAAALVASAAGCAASSGLGASGSEGGVVASGSFPIPAIRTDSPPASDKACQLVSQAEVAIAVGAPIKPPSWVPSGSVTQVCLFDSADPVKPGVVTITLDRGVTSSDFRNGQYTGGITAVMRHSSFSIGNDAVGQRLFDDRQLSVLKGDWAFVLDFEGSPGHPTWPSELTLAQAAASRL